MAKKKIEQKEIKEIIEQQSEAVKTPSAKPIAKVNLGTVHATAWLNPNTKTGSAWINVKLVVDYKKNSEDTEFVHQTISMNVKQLNQTLDCLTGLKLQLLKEHPNLMK